jgi:hypothetical protein
MSRDEYLARLERIERGFAARLDAVEAENVQLRERVRTLTEQLEAARRAGKRQAAPFAKGEPVAQPRAPGRKPGPAHGGGARPRAPAPGR